MFSETLLLELGRASLITSTSATGQYTVMGILKYHIRDKAVSLYRAILDLAGCQPQDIDNFVNELYKEGEKIGYKVEFHRETQTANISDLSKVVSYITALLLNDDY